MKSIRKFAAVIAGLWVIGVIALGVGGTWLTHNPEAHEDAAMELMGIDADAARAKAEQKRAERAAKREARQFEDGGWGTEAVPGQDDALEEDGWDD